MSESAGWRVAAARSPLVGELQLPGDKSIGHRAALFGALADGESRVVGLSGGEDNRRTLEAVAALGAAVRPLGDGAWSIRGCGLGGLRAAASAIDCGNSGTTMRLLAGLLAGQRFESRLEGDASLVTRPMGRVARPLSRLGGRVSGRSGGGRPEELYAPLIVGGVTARLQGARVETGVASAQVKSALLLAALGAEGRTTIVEPGPSRDHSERMLAAMGAPIRRSSDGLVCEVDPAGWQGRLAPRDVQVPGDLSSAAFLIGAALLVPGSRLVLRGVGVNPTRSGVLDVIEAMGGCVSALESHEEGGEPVADLLVEASLLRGVTIAGSLALRAIDELPLLAVLAAHAEGVTQIRDAAELRVKESDRIRATASLLRGFGVEVEEHPDGLIIHGQRQGTRRAALPGARVESRGDHRIAMAGAVCALAASGVSTVDDVRNVATSFPGFERCLATVGAEIERL